MRSHPRDDRANPAEPNNVQPRLPVTLSTDAMVKVLSPRLLRLGKKLHHLTERHRKTTTGFAGLLFLAGLSWSLMSTNLNWNDVAPTTLLFLFFILTPAGLALAAVSLQVTARAVAQRVSFRGAFVASATSRIAEILPLPGGAIVRGIVLVRAGATLGQSTRITVVTALLTLFLALAFSSTALILISPTAGYLVLGISVLCIMGCIAPIGYRVGVTVALAMVIIRIATIGLAMIRISAAFSALGTELNASDAALFVVCSILGTSASVVPSGLGLNESLAAALALLVNISPSTAFLATAINRFFSLAVSGLVVAIFLPRTTFQIPE